MSQQPPNKEQQHQPQFQNQPQGQFYQAQGQGQTNFTSSQQGTNQYQQNQQGQPSQTYQGQQSSWQQGQQTHPTSAVQNQGQNSQLQQGQQSQWQQTHSQQGQQNQPQAVQNQNNPWQGQQSQSALGGVQNQNQNSQLQQGQQSQWQQQPQAQQSSQIQGGQTQSNPWQQGQGQQSQLQQPQNQQGQQNQNTQWQGQGQHQSNQWQGGQNQPLQGGQNQPLQGGQNQPLQGGQGGQSQNSPWQGQQPQGQQNQPQGIQNQTNPWQGQQPQGQQNQPQGIQNQTNPWQPTQGQQGQVFQSQHNQQGQQSQQPNQQVPQGQKNQTPSQQNFNQQGQNLQSQQIQPQQLPPQQGQNIQLQGVQLQQGQQQSPQKNQPQVPQQQTGQQPAQNQQQGQPQNASNQPSTTESKQQKSPKKGKKGEKGEKETKDTKQSEKKPQGDKKKEPEPAPENQTTPTESKEIIIFMKKKPYSQKIGNIEYTYSLLSKKQASFVGSHDRFLYLKGYESISYAREFDAKTVLPFTEEAQVPKAKTTYLLTQIDKCTNEQEKLIIDINADKKVKWEFVCPSKDCSLKWKKKIQSAKKTFDEFKTSGAPSLEEFIRYKEAQNQQTQINQQNAANTLMSTPYSTNQQSPNKSQLSSNSTIQSSQFSPQQNNFQSTFQNQQNTGSTFQSTFPNQQQNVQNPNKPISVAYQGSQAARINNFIEGNTPQPRNYLNQSMSRIPVQGKQDIRNDIKKIKRNWIEELLGGQQEVELVIQFKNYVQRIAEVIVNELYVPQEAKMYPAHEFAKEFASYLVDDIYIEIYLQVEDNPSIKNQRYKSAVTEFKNFEYLLGATKNEGILKVPFMTLFEYRGFLGMAKSKVGDGRGFKNKEFYELINRREFQEITRISAETLLNENKCKIVSYDRKNTNPRLSTQYNKVYFVERLADFLPLSDKDFGPTQDKILRREFISDEEFEDQVFRDRVRQVKNDKINSIIDKKITELVRVLEHEESYFTNSQELTELIHLYGLNIHYLGTIFKKTKHSWLKRIFQAQIAARCLKNVYRLDLQNCILSNYNKNNNQERQEEREKNQVISFLNVIFGNTEPTFRLWRNINTTAIDKYHTKIWDNEFTDVNTGYLLQAIQTHFKITLTENVSQRKFFKSMGSFGPRDFVRFNFDATIYNLDFTNTFELIYESFEEENLESFQTIGQILTKETSTNIPYLELLKSHPIHDKISQFFLNFISPEDNSELYNKIEEKYLPHKFLYESKFAQIKWYLKANKSDKITKAANFIEEHAKRWLGDTHPLYTQLNRMLAEYFSEMQIYYSKALKYATASLNMQQALFEGDSELLWRDYYLIGKIHYFNNRVEESLTYLTKAKGLVKVENLTEFEVYGELCLMLAKGYFGVKYYKESYSIVRELYKTIREERDERSLVNIVEAVTLIKQLLEINQEHESYYKFVESDFSSIVYAFADYPTLMNQSIKMITIPYLKNVILRNSKNKHRLLSIIEEISKIKQSPNSCNAYIKAKISEGTFPKSYLHCLKEIDSVIDEILANQMIERWKSFNNLANQSILDKIGNSQINRGFDFLANMTALFNLLGQEVLEQLFIMEK